MSDMYKSKQQCDNELVLHTINKTHCRTMFVCLPLEWVKLNRQQ